MTPFEMVLEFHEKFGCAIDDRSSDTVGDRLDLMAEELNELFVELDPAVVVDHYGGGKVDWEAVAKELADVVYIALGHAVAWGIDFDKAFARVHESNMSKLWEDGNPRYREGDGKVLKPPTYVKPNLSDTVKEL